VIGANSVVTKPIPAFTVAAGAPARELDYFGPEEKRETVAEPGG
jgi:acetyltransferase-like isoleucine patch superfamily enzyme